MFDQVPVMKFLLEQNDVDLNHQDSEGATAMHYACSHISEGKVFEGKPGCQWLLQKPFNFELKVNYDTSAS